MPNTRGNPSGRSAKAGAVLHAGIAGREATAVMALARRGKTTVVDQVEAGHLGVADPAEALTVIAATTGVPHRTTGGPHHPSQRHRWCALNSCLSQTASPP